MQRAQNNNGKTTNHKKWHGHHWGSNTLQYSSMSFPSEGKQANKQNEPKISPPPKKSPNLKGVSVTFTAALIPKQSWSGGIIPQRPEIESLNL